MALSKRLRFAVFKRDLFTCQYCGNHPPAVILEADHIDPVANGGTDAIDNLITACFNCNRGKADIPLSVVPQSLADKAIETAEREAQILGYQKIMEARRERIEAECWRVAQIWMERYGQESIRRDYFQSINRFVNDLGVHECMEAMEKAVAKCYYESHGWKYFCGICWRLIESVKQPNHNP